MSEANGTMNTEIAPGDKVSWTFGGSNPSGKVEEVKPNEVSITTHRGNEVSKPGSKDDPAVKVSIGGKPVARKAHELNVDKGGPNHDKAGTMTSTSESGNVKPSQEQSGEKIAAEKEEKKNGGLEVPKGGRGKSKSKSPAPAEKKEEKKEEKAKEPEKKEAAKKDDKPAAEKKKSGRKPGAPKAAGGPKKEKVKKRAATEDGEPRRSKRTKT